MGSKDPAEADIAVGVLEQRIKPIAKASAAFVLRVQVILFLRIARLASPGASCKLFSSSCILLSYY